MLSGYVKREQKNKKTFIKDIFNFKTGLVFDIMTFQQQQQQKENKMFSKLKEKKF